MSLKKDKGVILIGYSGHAYVVCDILISQNRLISGYCETKKQVKNPYQLEYFGKETDIEAQKLLMDHTYFVAIGNNQIRKRIQKKLESSFPSPTNAIHKLASISPTAELGNGIMAGDGAIVNSCTVIGDGVICNTQCVIEHESKIGAFSHVGPGAVLCGNVEIGENTFIGARAVVKQGVKIGDNVTVGAGTVVVEDIPHNSKVVGNPQKFIV